MSISKLKDKKAVMKKDINRLKKELYKLEDEIKLEIQKKCKHDFYEQEYRYSGIGFKVVCRKCEFER